MPRTVQRPYPAAQRQMKALGERLRTARKRRRLTAVLFAERMGISRDTLHRLEQGDDAIALGTYLRALRILGLEADLDAVARDDRLGRTLQDLALEPTPRQPRKPPAEAKSDG